MVNNRTAERHLFFFLLPKVPAHTYTLKMAESLNKKKKQYFIVQTVSDLRGGIGVAIHSHTFRKSCLCFRINF